MPRWLRPIGLLLAVVALSLILGARSRPSSPWLLRTGQVLAVASAVLLVANAVAQFRSSSRK